MDTTPSTPSPPNTLDASTEGAAEAKGEVEVLRAPSGSVPPVGSAPVSTTTTGPTAPVEDRYDYDRATILVVIQLRPVTGNEQPRAVWVSVQNGIDNKEDFPLIRFTTVSEWEQVLSALLEELKRDLPRRKLLHEQRQAKPASTVTASPVRPVPSSAAVKKMAPSASTSTKLAAPPPVPPASSPIPKQELAMPGLFDEL